MSKANDLKSFKTIAEDLSLINGLPNKINADYVRNIQQLIIYKICEQRLSGKKEVAVEIPLIGILTIRVSNSKAKDLDLKLKDLSFSFEPFGIFSEDVLKAFNNEGFDLPEMLANRYGDKILKVYNEFF